MATLFVGFILFTNMYDAQTSKNIKKCLYFLPHNKTIWGDIYSPILPFVQFCDVIKVASNPQEDLAKFGYEWNMKVKNI